MTVEYKNLTVKSKIVKKIFKGCIIKSDNIKIIVIWRSSKDMKIYYVYVVINVML